MEVWEETYRTVVIRGMSPSDLDRLSGEFRQCILAGLRNGQPHVQFSMTSQQSALFTEKDLPVLLSKAYGEGSPLADPSGWQMDDFGGRKMLKLPAALFHQRSSRGFRPLAQVPVPVPAPVPEVTVISDSPPPPIDMCGGSMMDVDSVPSSSASQNEEMRATKRQSPMKTLVKRFHRDVVQEKDSYKISSPELWVYFCYWYTYCETKGGRVMNPKYREQFKETFMESYPHLAKKRGKNICLSSFRCHIPPPPPPTP